MFNIVLCNMADDFTRSTDEYCNTWFQSVRTENASVSTACDDCYMELALLRANSPVEVDSDIYRTMYTSMSASCAYNGPALTTATPIVSSS